MQPSFARAAPHGGAGRHCRAQPSPDCLMRDVFSHPRTNTAPAFCWHAPLTHAAKDRPAQKSAFGLTAGSAATKGGTVARIAPLSRGVLPRSGQLSLAMRSSRPGSFLARRGAVGQGGTRRATHATGRLTPTTAQSNSTHCLADCWHCSAFRTAGCTPVRAASACTGAGRPQVHFERSQTRAPCL